LKKNKYEILKKKNKKSPWRDDPGRHYDCGLEFSDDEESFKYNRIHIDFECINCGSYIRKWNVQSCKDDSNITTHAWGCDCCGEGITIKINGLRCPVCNQLHHLEIL
jgi:hypothetical protein